MVKLNTLSQKLFLLSQEYCKPFLINWQKKSFTDFMVVMRIFPATIKSRYLVIAGAVATIATVPLKELSRPDFQVKDSFTECVNNPKTIVVVDDFVHKDVTVDCDFIGDISHGEVSSFLLEQGLPNANILKRNIFPPRRRAKKAPVLENLDTLCRSMLNDIREGKKFDAINLSLGFSIPYPVISREFGKQITPENIRYYAKDIKQYLKTNPDKEFSVIASYPKSILASVLDKLDTLSSKGVKIYHAGGNSSDSHVCFLSLVDDVFNVGALDKRGRQAIYSNKSSLVNRWENGVVKSEMKEEGYDITGDGKVDVPFKRATSWFKLQMPYMKLEGTSFAVPRAIIKDFSQE